MGSGRSAAEEREMVERLRLHTDTTRVEARAALVACGWHEGRAAEQLLPAQIYLSPQDRRAEKIRQVREIARVDARWAELALDACDGDAEAAVAFVCGGMSPPSQRAATALDESSSVLAAARRARATPLPDHDDRPAPLATPASPVVRTAPPTTEQNLVSPKALDAIPDADVVAQAAADLERAALREAEGRKRRRSLPSPVTPLSPERRAASLAAASTTLAAASLEMQQRLDAAAARDAANEALQAERDRNRRAALAAAEQRAREAAEKRAAAALQVQAAHRGRGGRIACVARREAAALLLACARRRLDRVTAQAEAERRRDAGATLSSCARRRQDRLTAQAEAERRRDAGETLSSCARRRRQDRLAAQAEAERGGGVRRRRWARP